MQEYELKPVPFLAVKYDGDLQKLITACEAIQEHSTDSFVFRQIDKVITFNQAGGYGAELAVGDWLKVETGTPDGFIGFSAHPAVEGDNDWAVTDNG